MGSYGFCKMPSAPDTLLVNEKRSPFPHTVINQAYILNFFRNCHAELYSGDPQWYFT